MLLPLWFLLGVKFIQLLAQLVDRIFQRSEILHQLLAHVGGLRRERAGRHFDEVDRLLDRLTCLQNVLSVPSGHQVHLEEVLGVLDHDIIRPLQRCLEVLDPLRVTRTDRPDPL